MLLSIIAIVHVNFKTRALLLYTVNPKRYTSRVSQPLQGVSKKAYSWKRSANAESIQCF